MNTSLQLYNTTLYPNICPLWPEFSTLETAPAPLAAGTGSVFKAIKDYMPKTWDDALPFFIDGYMVKECLTGVPYSCASALAAKILPASELPETAIISSRGPHFRPLFRYAAYKIEISRRIRWLLPCMLRLDLPSCVKYHIDGGKSYAIKLLEKGQMPDWGTVPLFIFNEILNLKAVETALSCAFEPWTECVKNTAQLFIGVKTYRFFAEES